MEPGKYYYIKSNGRFLYNVNPYNNSVRTTGVQGFSQMSLFDHPIKTNDAFKWTMNENGYISNKIEPNRYIDRIIEKSNFGTDIKSDVYTISSLNKPKDVTTRQWRVEGNGKYSIINDYDDQCLSALSKSGDYAIVMRPCNKNSRIWEINEVEEKPEPEKKSMKKSVPDNVPVETQSKGLSSSELGMIIGIPLGVLALILIIFVIYKKRESISVLTKRITKK
jgi:hypothetical protein